MKKIDVFPTHSRFPVKLLSCIDFGLASCAFCLLKYIAIILQCFPKQGESSRQPVDNLVDNHLLDMSRFFECYHLFLYNFILVD